ncbi:EXS family protein [Salix suchowensis]|nr:EXS family protein [Salix suchowensis]
MKFGKHFKQQKVPEWTNAYMDYNGLKRILAEILQYKQSRQPSTPLRAAIQHKLTSHRHFSGLNLQSTNLSSEGDIEDQVIDVNASPEAGSRNFYYKTEFLRESEEGGEIEAKFFKKLDEELNNVNTFYKDKSEEMKHEAFLLNKQMDALIALRIKVENPHFDGSDAKKSGTTGVATTNPLKNSGRDTTSGREHMELTSELDRTDCNQEESTHGSEVIEVQDKDHGNAHQEKDTLTDYNEDPLKILEHVKINSTLKSPLATIKGVFKDSKEEELSFKKEELKKVEEPLRVALIEFYQKLLLLKHYSYMNLAAFSKIMKKYEKISSRRASRSYMKTVDNSCLGNSDEVNGLLERVEVTFIKYFANSNRREGMNSLRPKAKRVKHSSVIFFSGFFCGCSIALLIAVVLRIQARKLMDKAEGASYMVNIFPLYSLFAFIVLHILIHSANIYFWRQYRVNYPFIFGFKQGTELGHRDLLANLHLDLGSKASNYKTITELVPLGLVTVVLVIIFSPFNIIYRSSRFFFVQCLFRCICAPLYKVRLADFFLADHLTSQVQAIRSIELYICYYGLGEYSRRQNKCHSHGAYNAFYFVVAVAPFWLRLLQCIRRLCEEKDAVHGYNGLKYFLTIIAVLIRTAYELKKGTTWMVLALISSAVAVIVNTYWDIAIDWGLLRRKSKNAFLRDKLVISHKSVYFAAMILNVALRLAWMQLVIEFNLHSLHKMAVTTTISCLEIIRRGIWSFFRLENEHLNNVGKYRAFKSVPLPFTYYDTDADKDD